MVINWQFYSKNKLIDDLKNIDCAFENKQIIVSFNDSKNIIDIDKKRYIRFYDNYQMIIDFKKKTVTFKLENINPLEYEINCEFAIEKNVIKLTYNIDDDDEKKIIIERKEEK